MADVTSTCILGGKLIYVEEMEGDERIVICHFSTRHSDNYDYENWNDKEKTIYASPPSKKHGFSAIVYNEAGWDVPMDELLLSEQTFIENLLSKKVALLQTNENDKDETVVFKPGISYSKFLEKLRKVDGEVFVTPLVPSMLPPIQMDMFDQSFALFAYQQMNNYMMRNGVVFDGDNNMSYASILAGIASDYLMLNNSTDQAHAQFAELMDSAKARMNTRCAAASKALH